MLKSETKNHFAAGLVFFLALFLFFSDILVQKKTVGGISVQGRDELPVVQEQRWKAPSAQGGVQFPNIGAKAIFIKDPDSQAVLYEKNASEKLPTASLAKLMTALVVTKLASPEEMVEIEPPDTTIMPNKTDLRPGEKVLVKDLLNAMLVASANDAAVALARHVGGDVETFVSYMNIEAKKLGMRNTAFKNPVGFDDVGQFSTARDLATLAEEFSKHSDLMEIVGQKDFKFYSLENRQHFLTATNKLLENPQVLGIKTGYTNEAKGNIIILARPEEAAEEELGPRYYFVILGSDSRERDAKALINWVENNFVWN